MRPEPPGKQENRSLEANNKLIPDKVYSLRAKDYVTVVAVTPEKHLVLVRQFRPSVGRSTLELPSGHVEDGDTPEVAARKKFLEETDFVADRFDFLGQLCPDTGLMANRLWCFLAAAGNKEL